MIINRENEIILLVLFLSFILDLVFYFKIYHLSTHIDFIFHSILIVGTKLLFDNINKIIYST